MKINKIFRSSALLICIGFGLFVTSATASNDSSSVKPIPVQTQVKGYILSTGNSIWVPTWYYRENPPVTLLGTAQFCPFGFYPQVVFSIGSESPMHSCGENFSLNQSYCRTVQSGYELWGKAWLRHEEGCPDDGLYISYVLYCMPGNPSSSNCPSE